MGLDPRVVPAILGELRVRSAVLHAHDAHALTLAGISAALTGAPLVVTRRVTFPLRHRFFWRRACRVIAISESVREALTAAGIGADHVVVVPDGADIKGMQASAGQGLRELTTFPFKGQLAVTLGALTPEKDHSTLIGAAALLAPDLPNLHWVVVGDGHLRTRLEQEILQFGLQERIHLLGDMPDPHIALASADVFVLSSRAEGFGSSILAAMALGLPVVATRVGGAPDLLESGGGLLVPPGDKVQLAAAVYRVLTDQGLSRDLTRVAQEMLGRFSIGAVAEQVLEVYRSCAHSLDGS
jgi:glycosyltransferase involved in cell wall biosynthesis